MGISIGPDNRLSGGRPPRGLRWESTRRQPKTFQIKLIE